MITLLGVYIVILGFMTFTLFQGHRCVRNINCGFWFLSSFIRKIMHNMICVTLVCIQWRYCTCFSSVKYQGLSKTFNVGIYSDTMSNFAHWSNGSLIFTCWYHFQWPWPYFKVTAVSNSFNWKFCVLIQLSLTFYNCGVKQANKEYTTILHLSTVQFQGR